MMAMAAGVGGSRDQLYLLENGCHGGRGGGGGGGSGGVGHPDYAVDDVYHSPKDPFDG